MRTKLILELDVGEFPEGTDPSDYEEYLQQSSHLMCDFEIIGVIQEVDN